MYEDNMVNKLKRIARELGVPTRIESAKEVDSAHYNTGFFLDGWYCDTVEAAEEVLRRDAAERAAAKGA